MFDLNFFIKILLTVIEHIPISLYITFISLLIGCIIALPVAIARFYRVPILDPLFKFIITILQGTPTVLILLVVYLYSSNFIVTLIKDYQLNFRFRDINTSIFAIFSFSLLCFARASEIFRSALMSIDLGQFEAGEAFGFTKKQLFKKIIFPQMIPTIIPQLSNLVMGLLKGSSLVILIGIVDMLNSAVILANKNYRFFEAYFGVALIYWLLCIIIGWIFDKIEIRYRYMYRSE